MSRATSDTAAEVNDWIDGDPRREALLIGEVPMKPTTLAQLKSGSYRPSEDFYEKIRQVMIRYPRREDPPPEAA